MIKLFINGFSLDWDELDVVKLLAPFGDVVTIKLVRDKQNGKSRGYAFVEMKEQEGAERARADLDGRKMRDGVLTVNFVVEKIAVRNPVYQKSKSFGQFKTKRP